MRSKALDFVGDVRLKASISNTQTGFKSWVLKPFDPLFRTKGAGTLLKIKVQGSPDAPVVGLDLKKTLKAR